MPQTDFQITPAVEAAVAAERERCLELIGAAISTAGTVHETVHAAIRAIRRGDSVACFHDHLCGHHHVARSHFGGAK